MKRTIRIMICVLAAMLLCGCFGGYRITYDKELVTSCPKSAKAGETVEFETVIVDDADIHVFINEVELQPVKEGCYSFVMPEGDVTIRVAIVSNGLA